MGRTRIKENCFRLAYLEVWTNTDTRDDLENDDFGPVCVGVEVDEETEAESHKGHAKPDRWSVLANILDENSDTYRTGG